MVKILALTCIIKIGYQNASWFFKKIFPLTSIIPREEKNETKIIKNLRKQNLPLYLLIPDSPLKSETVNLKILKCYKKVRKVYSFSCELALQV